MASRRTPTRSLTALAFGSKRPTSPGPPSPTFSEATQASAMNFGPNGPQKIITRMHLKASLQAYEDVSTRTSPAGFGTWFNFVIVAISMQFSS